MDEFYWNNGIISKLEFTPNSDVSKKIICSILEKVHDLEGRYTKSPKYLVLGITEQLAIRAECAERNGYDAGDLTVI